MYACHVCGAGRKDTSLCDSSYSNILRYGKTVPTMNNLFYRSSIQTESEQKRVDSGRQRDEPLIATSRAMSR